MSNDDKHPLLHRLIIHYKTRVVSSFTAFVPAIRRMKIEKTDEKQLTRPHEVRTLLIIDALAVTGAIEFVICGESER